MPTKSNFQLVNLVLDELRADVEQIHGGDTDAVIKAELAQLSASYQKLHDPNFPPIDYAKPETRLAYVYAYVATHADYIYQIMQGTSEHLGNDLAAHKKIVITCLGGGPGSELVGFVQYCLKVKSDSLRTVTAYLCDREQAWADCWTEIGEEVDDSFNLHVNFQPLDVTNETSWSKQKKFLSADLFICSYFASEVARLGDSAQTFWSKVGAEAKSRAMMLIIDNNHPIFKTYIEKNIVGAHWTIVGSSDVQLTPSGHEQKSDLGDHLKNFERSPKLKGNITFWILRKD